MVKQIGTGLLGTAATGGRIKLKYRAFELTEFASDGERGSYSDSTS